MKYLGLNEIREKYLAFFESKGHLRMPSFSLVPHNDASLLLINSGMAPLKPYFTGAEIPPRKRVTTCQKCIRTPDIENVGKTARHGTFFEMLGNFSFGDYFKKEVIPWAWEFMTKVMEIPGDRLYVTIYNDDDEAFDIWTKDVGLSPDRIYRMGKEDNFWEHGTGPCGPCSEIHFDRGEKYGCGKPDCKVGCDCDRFIEVWNLVFTQFDRQEDGSYEKLANPNIDTGMGLERLACVMQGVDNLFEVDTVRRILDTVCHMSDKEYGKEWKTDVSIRVITDHIRSTVMMISDGVVPSNEARGYVLRRLLRGAARHGKKLGIKKAFLSDLAGVVIEESGGAYPNLIEKQDYIKKVIRIEEERFASTIEQGIAMLNDTVEVMKKEGITVLAGKEAFKLHDTYGFPLDLTKDILAEMGFTVDEEAFRAEMNQQKAKAREALKGRESSWSNSDIPVPADTPETTFLGYKELECDSKILHIINTSGDPVEVKAAEAGDTVLVITEESTFYAESGGQIGDTGVISTDTGKIKIMSVTKTADKKWRHMGYVAEGSVESGDDCHMSVDRRRRLAIQRNHSATHLLQKALKIVIGDHVHQAGSSVNEDRLRFDFNNMEALSAQQIKEVEKIVNDEIYNALSVVTAEMSVDDAKASGAMALFGEKYGDVVRVVSMGDFSKELCGGTHVTDTSTIGSFKILHEGAVAAGIRRIEAITGEAVTALRLEQEDTLEKISVAVRSNVTDVINKVESLVSQNKNLAKEIEQLRKDMASGNLEDIIAGAVEINGVKVLAARFDMLEGEALRDMAENLRSKLDKGIVVLASGAGDKVSIVAMATKSAVAEGINCGGVVRKAASICGGGGGGRPDMAQAGGKNPGKIDEMLDVVRKGGAF